MKKFLLFSLILVSAMCGLAGTTGNYINRNTAGDGNCGFFIPCGITLTSAPGTDDQTVCINTPITDITYSTSIQTQAVTFSGLPAGVTGSYDAQAHLATISGTPAEAGGYTYQVTASGMQCSQSYRTGSITVTSDATIALTSAPGTNNQTLCTNTPITNITYDIRGGGTGAGVTGLPPGVTAIWHPMPLRMISIYGTPTVSGTFNYTVTTTGPCANATATGTITVDPNSTISLTSDPGTTDQTVCINTPITSITYFISEWGTEVEVTGLPPGVTGAYMQSSQIFLIWGIPTESGIFHYVVTTTGTCPQSVTGTIAVKSGLSLVSYPGSNNQSICVNTGIETIAYSIDDMVTGATATGLPPGVAGTFNPWQYSFAINGTPTETGNFNYTVTITGGACSQATATGSIEVVLNTDCMPDYTTGCTSSHGLTYFQLGTTSSEIFCNGYPSSWYHDYTDRNHICMNEYTTYTLTVKAGHSYTFVDVWIDLNNNNFFDQPSEIVVDDLFCAIPGQNYTASIMMPGGLTAGYHRLRFRTNYLDPVTDPWATLTYGNSADFMVDLVPYGTITIGRGNVKMNWPYATDDTDSRTQFIDLAQEIITAGMPRFQRRR